MRNKKSIGYFLKRAYEQRYPLKILVIRDFTGRYLSSYIGLPWAFIQPVIFVFIIWFAFAVGLRAGNTSAGMPFAPWLLAGMLPWLFLSQTLVVTCNSIHEYAYLIRKTALNIWLIPIIKILSGLIIHFIMIILLLFLFITVYDIYPDIHWFQFIYYLFAMIILLTGLSWLLSSINVLVPDMGHVINILTTILFWATPIIWPYESLHGNMRYMALLNPFFYITEGYRYTFLGKMWVFQFTEMNMYFWSVTLVLFLLGAFTFKKLQPSFGDVL
jgi:ABC-type polysaccharide/polyol phosphate export permease